jgi:WD40 repeat protein
VLLSPRGQDRSQSKERTAFVADTSEGKKSKPVGEAAAAASPAGPFAGHKGAVTSVAFSPDGMHLLSGGADGTARLWDAATGKEVRKLALSPAAPVSHVCFSGDGKRLGVFPLRFKSRVYDTESGALQYSFSPLNLNYPVIGCLSRDGMAALAPSNMFLGVFKAKPGVALATPQPLPKHVRITCTAYAADGSFYAFGEAAGHVRAGMPADDRQLAYYKPHTGPVECLAVHGGAAPRILSGGSDKLIVLRNGITTKANERRLYRLTGHEGAVTALSVSGDGKLLASASKDRTVRVWNLDALAEKHRFTDEDAVLGVALAPNGKAVASCGSKGIRFRQLPGAPP